MAYTKTLMAIAIVMCLLSTAEASVFLEKWIAVFEKGTATDSSSNRFMKVMLWQIWGCLAPLMSGMLRVMAYAEFEALSVDAKYGMAVAGLANFEDVYAYVMNYVLYKVVLDNLGGFVTYTPEEFTELDLSSFATLS